MKDKKRNIKKNRLAGIVVILVIGLIVLFLFKNNTIKNDTEEIAENIPAKIIEDENLSEKDSNIPVYLQNLDVPVYKIDEKDIQVPILIYHAFGTPMPEDDVYGLFSCQANFAENVKTLKVEGYTFITLEDLYAYKNGELALPEKVMIITEDDGWLGCYTEVFPVLKAENVPMTIFIVNKLVGTDGYFSWEQAKEMYDTGLVKIHCHGYNHIEYGSLGKEKIQADYLASHGEIVKYLNDENIQKIMAYPAGKSTKESIEFLKEVGFEIQVQTKYGTVNKSDTLDLTGLGRIRAEKATGEQILKVVESKK